MTTPLVLDLPLEELRRRYPPASRGRPRDGRAALLSSLAPGESLVWDPCVGAHDSSGKACLWQISVLQAAKRSGRKVKSWHTQQGALVLLRLKEE